MAEDKPYIVGLWYLYSDGSREYIENCRQMSIMPRWIKRLWARLTT